MFSTIYCLYRNIFNFSSMSRIHFCFKNTPFKPMKMKNPKPPLPVAPHGPPSNTTIPQTTPFTIPNNSSIASCTSVQLHNKVRIGNNGTPQSRPKNYCFPFHNHHPHTLIPGPTPLITPNGIQIQSAILPQYIFWTDRQIDRQTDRWDR